jgi:hypothetical protein
MCTVFAVALPTKTAFTRYLLAEAARPIAEAWFDFLRNDEPQKALQLTLPAAQRRELNDELWDYYSKSKEARDELEEFVASPVPRVLLEFGESCQVRFYEINRVETDASGDTIELVYAVTYPEKPTNEGGSPSGKRTFFVLSTIERRPLPSGEIGWRVVRNIGGFQPTSLME